MTTRSAAAWADRLGLQRTGNEFHGPCPLCGGKDRFHVRDGDGGRAVVGCRGCIDYEDPGTRKARFLDIVNLVFGENPREPRSLSRAEREQIQEEGRKARQLRVDQATNARKRAMAMLQKAEVSTHPYFARKGFPEHQCLVLDDKVLIPVRAGGYGDIASVQTIEEDGTKKFLYGSNLRGSYMVLGRGPERWVVEGVATGLSVAAALKRLYRNYSIKVAFSAGNFPNIADEGDRLVCDHDLYTCRRCENRWSEVNIPIKEMTLCRKCGGVNTTPPAGQRFAEKAGERWWMPPEPGDANDYHLKRGLPALAEGLSSLTRPAK